VFKEREYRFMLRSAHT